MKRHSKRTFSACWRLIFQEFRENLKTLRISAVACEMKQRFNPIGARTLTLVWGAIHHFQPHCVPFSSPFLAKSSNVPFSGLWDNVFLKSSILPFRSPVTLVDKLLSTPRKDQKPSLNSVFCRAFALFPSNSVHLYLTFHPIVSEIQIVPKAPAAGMEIAMSQVPPHFNLATLVQLRCPTLSQQSINLELHSYRPTSVLYLVLGIQSRLPGVSACAVALAGTQWMLGGSLLQVSSLAHVIFQTKTMLSTLRGRSQQFLARSARVRQARLFSRSLPCLWDLAEYRQHVAERAAEGAVVQLCVAFRWWNFAEFFSGLTRCPLCRGGAKTLGS